MADYARIVNDEPVLITGPFTVGVGDEAITYTSPPASMTPEDRAALGVLTVTPLSPLPAGMRATGAPYLEIQEDGSIAWVQPRALIPLAEIASERVDAVRALREQKEVAGIELNGLPLRTDERSQNKAAGAVVYLSLRPLLTGLEWEAQPGLYVDLTRAEVEEVAGAIGDHIQACFHRSRELVDTINAALAANDRAAVLALDITTGWPS